MSHDSRFGERVMGLVLATATLATFAWSQPAAEPPPSADEESSLPVYLRDRGTGVPSSMFGTYIRGGELFVYPFFEYYRDNNFEYSPDEFGIDDKTDFRGKYRANEGLLFFGYGLTDDVVVELEAAYINASLEKSPSDMTGVPDRIEESGLGDVEGQLRWRWKRETESRPELFSYFEFVFPHDKDKLLIGTPGWELKFGTGLVRGFRWGTITVRGAIEYSAASTSELDLGEYAIEYLKRVSRTWRFFVGLEGTQDELSLITEAQWHINRNIFVKLNNGIGLTSKAGDWTPEVGVVFHFPTR